VQTLASPSDRIACHRLRNLGETGRKRGKSRSGSRALRVFLNRVGTTSKFYLHSTVRELELDTLHRRSATSRPNRQYEFPTGFNAYFGAERFSIGELFFYHAQSLIVSINSIATLEVSSVC